MRNKNIFRQVCLVMMILMLSACGPSDESLTPTLDATLIYTQAAQTVAAQFTQTSAAQTAAAPMQTNTLAPLPTLAASFTPFATLPIFTLPAGTFQITPTFSILPVQATPTGALCDNSAYIRDVGTPDGTILKPGQVFAKGWLIQNIGTCNWKVGYHLVRVGGNTDFGGDTFFIRLPSQIVLAGKIVEVSINLVAPKAPGTYEARYQMYTDRGIPFGTGMTVAVEVRK